MAITKNNAEARELLGLLRKAKKAAAAAAWEEGGGGVAQETRCMDVLFRFKTYPVSAQTLIPIQAGNILKSLKKHSSNKISYLASDLYSFWSKKVVRQPTAEIAKGTPISCSSPSLLKSNEPLRGKIRERLHEGLSKVLAESKETAVTQLDPVRVAIDVENALFEKWGMVDGSNSAKYRSLLFNIRDPKNEDFRRKMLVGEIKAAAVVWLSTEEMASDAMRHEIKVMGEKALLRSITGMAKKGTTDAFKCGRCGKRETSYYQLQTRSADEPMTTYVTCMSCDKRWKF